MGSFRTGKWRNLYNSLAAEVAAELAESTHTANRTQRLMILICSAIISPGLISRRRDPGRGPLARVWVPVRVSEHLPCLQVASHPIRQLTARARPQEGVRRADSEPRAGLNLNRDFRTSDRPGGPGRAPAAHSEASTVTGAAAARPAGRGGSRHCYGSGPRAAESGGSKLQVPSWASLSRSLRVGGPQGRPSRPGPGRTGPELGPGRPPGLVDSEARAGRPGPGPCTASLSESSAP